MAAWMRGSHHESGRHHHTASCRLPRSGRGWVCSWCSEKVPGRPWRGSCRLALHPPSWPERSWGKMLLEGFQKRSLWQLRHLTLLPSLWVGKGAPGGRFDLQRVRDGGDGRQPAGPELGACSTCTFVVLWVPDSLPQAVSRRHWGCPSIQRPWVPEPTVSVGRAGPGAP